MPLRAEWDTTVKATVLLTYDGKWTVNDMHQFFDEVARMSQEANCRVNILSDMRNAASSPINMFAVLTRAERVFSTHVNSIVVVAANNYFIALSNIAKSISPNAFSKFHFVSSMEEAYKTLNVDMQPPIEAIH